MNREEYESLINNIRDGMDETLRATQSENFLNALSSYNARLDELDVLEEENSRLKKEKDELLLTNGKLFQQIGFAKKENTNDNTKKNNDMEEKIKLEDIINDKGEMI